MLPGRQRRSNENLRTSVFFQTEFLCTALALLELTYSVDLAGLQLRNLPASASQGLGLKACATTAWQELSSEHVPAHFKQHTHYQLHSIRVKER